MTSYLPRRLLLIIPTVIGITFLVFMLIALSPGGVDGGLAHSTGSGEAAQRAAEREYLRERYGLDRPLIVQYLHWLNRISPVRFGGDQPVTLAAPELGRSFARSRPVADLIASALPTTLLLNALSLIVVYVIAVPLGVLAAVRRGWIDGLLRLVLIALWSTPVVVLAVVLQGVLARPGLGWLPATGLHSPDASGLPFLQYLIDAAKHLILPVACLSCGSLALLARQTRAAVLENMNADHVRAARARGLPPAAVFTRHVFRNSLLPQITLLASVFPAMLSGSIVVESIFNLPGMGTLMLESIDLRDREVLMAVVLLISLVNIAAMLLADLLYAAADPRITFHRRTD